MDAAQLFIQLMHDAGRIEKITSPKEFVRTGVLSVQFKNLTEKEREDLSHLRMSNINGAIFDDRNKKSLIISADKIKAHRAIANPDCIHPAKLL